MVKARLRAVEHGLTRVETEIAHLATKEDVANLKATMNHVLWGLGVAVSVIASILIFVLRSL